MGEPVAKKHASLASILMAVRDPKDLFALCSENKEVEEICKNSDFQRKYTQANKQALTKYLETNYQPTDWTNTVIMEGIITISSSIGFLSIGLQFANLRDLLSQQKDKITEAELTDYCIVFGMRHCELMSIFLDLYLNKFKANYSKTLDLFVRTAVSTYSLDILKMLLVSRHFDLKCNEEETYSLATLSDEHVEILKLFDITKFNASIIHRLTAVYLRRAQLVLFSHVTRVYATAEMRNYIASEITTTRMSIDKKMMPYLNTYLQRGESYWRVCFIGLQIDFSWLLSITKEFATIRCMFLHLQMYKDPNVMEKYHELFAHLDNAGANYNDLKIVSTFILSIPITIAKTLLKYKTFVQWSSPARLFLLRNMTD